MHGKRRIELWFALAEKVVGSGRITPFRFEKEA